MDNEVSTLQGAGGSPYLLGTGSTGMLLITTKPMGEQTPGRTADTDRVPNAHAHTSVLPSMPRGRPYGSGTHSRDSDSGISNGNSLSPSSRFNSHGHMDLPNTSRYGDASFADSPNGLDTSINGLSPNDFRPRGMSRLAASNDYSSPGGRSMSMTRLNTSQDWSSPVGRSFSPSRTRTGASTQDLNRSLRTWDGEANQALEESEDRRHLLVDRLKDAQETIKMQSQRLTDVEDSAKDTHLSLDDLRYRQKEYRKKIAILEREKASYHDKYLEGIKAREGLQYRIDALTTEVATLRTTTELIQTDMTRKDALIKHVTSTVAELEEENNKLIKCKETTTKEVSALRQSLELSKSRCEYLENHGQDTLDETNRLKEENFQLSQTKVKINQKLAGLEGKNYSMSEENKTIAQSVQNLTQDKQQMSKRLSSLEATVTDLKATLVSTSADKERFFQEKMELTAQLQNANFDRENLNKVRCSLEEQICELNAELDQSKLQADRSSDSKRQQQDELTAVKKVSEVLSMDLCGVKLRLDQAQEQNQSLEHTKKLAFQQHELYEQEIQSMETQLKQSKQMLATLRDEYQKGLDTSDQHQIGLKDEMKDLKAQRNQLELKCHETEAKLRQCEQNLKEHSDELTKEVDSWKDQCEKLTASNSRREMEMQTLNKAMADLEAEFNILNENNEVYRDQTEDLNEAMSEATRVKEENRRLLQERAENQQVIQLLEMQKSILSKTTEGSLNKVHDVQQLQYQVEQLAIDKQHLEEKIAILEQKERETKEKTPERSRDRHDDSADLPISARERLCELETQNHHLRALNNRITEQLTRVEQENVTIQTKFRDCVPKADFKSIEREKELLQESLDHLKDEYHRLDERYRKVVASNQTRSGDSQDARVLQKEKEGLESQVSVLTNQLSVLEGQLQTADDKKAQLQKQLDAVHEKLFSLCQEDNSQVLQLQKQLNNLTSELERSKSQNRRQAATIQSLKEDIEEEKTQKPAKLSQSLESAGEDLTAVRRELQQLGDVIQGKDAEIDQLDRQLATARDRLRNREKEVEMLTTSSGSGKDEGDGENNNSGLRALRFKKLEERVDELEDENEELSSRITKIKKERDQATSDADDLRDNLDDLQKVCDTDHTTRLEKMKKELASKDRQIESLEEQLRRNTSMEIRKLKRGASKVDLLKAENRRLQSQLPSASAHFPRFSSPDESSSTTVTPETSLVASRLDDLLRKDVSGTRSSVDALNTANDEDMPDNSTSNDDSSGEDEVNLSNTLQDELDSSLIRMQSNRFESLKTSGKLCASGTASSISSSTVTPNNNLRRSYDCLSGIAGSGRRFNAVFDKPGENPNSDLVDALDVIRSSYPFSRDQESTAVSASSDEMNSRAKGETDTSKPKSILKWASRYDFIDANDPTSSTTSTRRREAFAGKKSALSKVDFVEPEINDTSSSSSDSPGQESSGTDTNSTHPSSSDSYSNSVLSKSDSVASNAWLTSGDRKAALNPLSSDGLPRVTLKTRNVPAAKSPVISSLASRFTSSGSGSGVSSRAVGSRLGRLADFETLLAPVPSTISCKYFPWRTSRKGSHGGSPSDKWFQFVTGMLPTMPLGTSP